MPSRFLDEVPSKLIEDLSPASYSSAYATPYPQRGQRPKPGDDDFGADTHYSYEDEDQSGGSAKSSAAQRFAAANRRSGSGPLDNTAAFFGKAGSGFTPASKYPSKGHSASKMQIDAPVGRTGLGKGARVRHPKYGEGIIFAREGDGEDAKLTVQFSSHGMKKLVEKFAQLERL